MSVLPARGNAVNGEESQRRRLDTFCRSAANLLSYLLDPIRRGRMQGGSAAVRGMRQQARLANALILFSALQQQVVSRSLGTHATRQIPGPSLAAHQRGDSFEFLLPDLLERPGLYGPKLADQLTD